MSTVTVLAGAVVVVGLTALLVSRLALRQAIVGLKIQSTLEDLASQFAFGHMSIDEYVQRRSTFGAAFAPRRDQRPGRPWTFGTVAGSANREGLVAETE